MMKKLLFHPVTILVFTVFILAGILSLQRTTREIRSSTETIQNLDQEINQIEGQVADLEAELEHASSEFAKEKIIRDELLMQKPGEFVIQMPPIPSPSPKGEILTVRTPWEEWRGILL